MDEARRLFDAPIPGQGLTKKLGSSVMQQPPHHTNPNDALNHLWASLTLPKTAFKIGKLLEAGTSAEVLANSFLMAGFMKGRWTPTLMILMARTTLAMIVSIGVQQGVKDMKIFNPRDDMTSFMKQIKAIKQGKIPQTVDTDTGKTPDDSNEQDNDGTPKIGGAMASGM